LAPQVDSVTTFNQSAIELARSQVDGVLTEYPDVTNMGTGSKADIRIGQTDSSVMETMLRVDGDLKIAHTRIDPESTPQDNAARHTSTVTTFLNILGNNK
jgi:hypothetical protein